MTAPFPRWSRGALVGIVRAAKADIAKAIEPLEQRLAALEARAPNLRYVGTYSEGTVYDVGNFVTCAGSLWHCQERTTAKPGDGAKEWKLAVKRGRDGRDK